MDLYLLLTCLFLLVASRNAAEEVPSAAEAYWRLTLPNTAIPASLKATLDRRVRLERINATTIVLMASIDGKQKYKRYSPPTSAENTATETSRQDQKEKLGRMDASNVVLTASIDGKKKYKRYSPPTSVETSRQNQKEKLERMDATDVVITASIDGKKKYKRYSPPTSVETSRQNQKEKLERMDATDVVLTASIDGKKKYKRYSPPTSIETSRQDQKEKLERMDATNVVLTASIDGKKKYKRYSPPTSVETSKQDQKEKLERMDATNVVLTASIDGKKKYKRYSPPTSVETSKQDEKEKLERMDATNVVLTASIDGKKKYKRYSPPTSAENTPTEGPIPETGRQGYFLEPELSIEKNRMKVSFKEVSSNKAVFLPRHVADTIPFSSKKTAQILQLFSVSRDSKAAGLMKETLEECEEPPFQGEEKVCATSLESVIDFAVQNLGRKVKAISAGEEELGDQDYLLMEGVKVIANRTVICHKERYPYAVHYCHATTKTKLYELPFQGVKDGRKATVVASCHLDTSAWDPNHISFHVLKVKPGTPVCHFFNRGTLIWFPN